MSQKERFESNRTDTKNADRIRQGVYEGLVDFRSRLRREKRYRALILAIGFSGGILVLDFLITAYPKINPPAERFRIERTQ